MTGPVIRESSPSYTRNTIGLIYGWGGEAFLEHFLRLPWILDLGSSGRSQVFAFFAGTFFSRAVLARGCHAVILQLPIPLLVASVMWRMKKRGWKQGHRELATTPSESHQSLSSLQADAGNYHHQQQQPQQPQPRAGNEYGAVTPTRNGQPLRFFPTAQIHIVIVCRVIPTTVCRCAGLARHRRVRPTFSCRDNPIDVHDPKRVHIPYYLFLSTRVNPTYRLYAYLAICPYRTLRKYTAFRIFRKYTTYSRYVLGLSLQNLYKTCRAIPSSRYGHGKPPGIGRPICIPYGDSHCRWLQREIEREKLVMVWWTWHLWMSMMCLDELFSLFSILFWVYICTYYCK